MQKLIVVCTDQIIELEKELSSSRNTLWNRFGVKWGFSKNGYIRKWWHFCWREDPWCSKLAIGLILLYRSIRSFYL
jgi:hypothetical protein